MTNFANEAWLRLSLCVSCTAIAAMFVSGKLLAQAVDRPDLAPTMNRAVHPPTTASEIHLIWQ